MATLTVYDQTKKEVGTIDLESSVFETQVRPEILHLVVRAHLANLRSGTHATKTRSFVSGGGAKPWRQKGTGRARSGSSRSPIWRHGAVVHGPQPRDYGFKVNKKVRSLALRMALSSRFLDEKLLVVDKIELPMVKTKLFSKVAVDLGLKKALIVLNNVDNHIGLSARNLPGIKVVEPSGLTVYDILNHAQLVIGQEAARELQERLK